MALQRDLKFGWLSPVIGNQWSDHQPIVMFQERNILPTALQHFESLWIADHFYGFDIFNVSVLFICEKFG